MFKSITQTKRPFKSAKDLLLSHDWVDQRAKSEKYVTKEYQDFGLRIAHALGDTQRNSLYIKLAKDLPRPVLEQALAFASDYYQVRNKAKVFMWKLGEIRKQYKLNKTSSSKPSSKRVKSPKASSSKVKSEKA